MPFLKVGAVAAVLGGDVLPKPGLADDARQARRVGLPGHGGQVHGTLGWRCGSLGLAALVVFFAFVDFAVFAVPSRTRLGRLLSSRQDLVT